MESGAKGCEVVVSGKLRAARAKSMKFTVRLRRSMGWYIGMDVGTSIMAKLWLYIGPTFSPTSI